MNKNFKTTIFIIVAILILYLAKDKYSSFNISKSIQACMLGQKKLNPEKTAKEAEKISSAIKLLHTNNPDIIVDGPIQSDFALNKEMLKARFPFSNLNGRKVNTLIFPNLDSANISYKIIKELDDAISIGPILIGLNRPVHILQLGASVEEIVNMAAISAIDSQRRKIRKK